MSTKKRDLPIVCDLSVFTPEQRKYHELASTTLMKDAKHVVELKDGFEFHHDYTDVTFLELAKWATMEHKCCPFFTFELVIEPFASGHEIIVRLRGGEQIKHMLGTELNKLGIKLTN